MKKLKNKAGFTLIELLVSLAIMVILVMGIGTGMDAGARVYKDSVFQSDSSSLEGILNTTLGDLLRYSENVIKNTGDPIPENKGNPLPSNIDFIFTSFDFGVKNAYFPDIDNTVKLRALHNFPGAKTEVDLINTGAYPDLKITNFKATYFPLFVDDPDNKHGGYFEITYTIQSVQDAKLKRNVEYVVRLMNPPEETTAPTTP